jgi:hypothetical protein
MNRRKIFLIESIFILLVGLLVTQQMSIADAADGLHSPITPLFPTPRMIMIFDTGLDTHVLSIDRYTEVTWINDSHNAVEIEFGKGSNCAKISATAFPALGIRMQPDRCFITSSIPPKGTLRFRFKEFGDYHYKVEYVGTNRVDHGELKVF